MTTQVSPNKSSVYVWNGEVLNGDCFSKGFEGSNHVWPVVTERIYTSGPTDYSSAVQLGR